jgi:hypothetical protein
VGESGIVKKWAFDRNGLLRNGLLRNAGPIAGAAVAFDAGA